MDVDTFADVFESSTNFNVSSNHDGSESSQAECNLDNSSTILVVTVRSDIPADTPSEYYYRCLSIPLFNCLLPKMGSCFATHQQTVLY